jgi:hypothetical protein
MIMKRRTDRLLNLGAGVLLSVLTVFVTHQNANAGGFYDCTKNGSTILCGCAYQTGVSCQGGDHASRQQAACNAILAGSAPSSQPSCNMNNQNCYSCVGAASSNGTVAQPVANAVSQSDSAAPSNTFDPSAANLNRSVGLNPDGTLKNSAPFGGGSSNTAQANVNPSAAAQPGIPGATTPGATSYGAQAEATQEAQIGAASAAARGQLSLDQQQTQAAQTNLTQANTDLANAQQAELQNPSQDNLNALTTAQANVQTVQTSLAQDNQKLAADQAKVAQYTASQGGGSGNGGGNGGGNGNGNGGNGNNNNEDKVMDGLHADKVQANQFKPSNEDCKLSGAVSADGSCSGMRTTMAVTQITAKVASQIGSQAVNMIGQQQQQSAMLNGASMATIYQGSAAMSAKAAEANIGMGAMQLGMGVLINSQANKHAKLYKNQLSKAKFGNDSDDPTPAKGTVPSSLGIVGSGSDDSTLENIYHEAAVAPVNADNSGTVFSSADMENRHARVDAASKDGIETLDAKQKAARTSAQSYAHSAAVEQNTASVDGHASALTNMAQGGGAMVSGAFQYAQAKAMEKLYAQMAAAPTVTAPGADAFAAPGAITGTNTITGTGTNPNTAAATAATAPAPASSGGPLGAPLGNIPGGPAFGTPTDPGAGAQAAATPGPQGGSLGGAAGGIGTSAVPGGPAEDKPATYDTARNAAGYEGVGGFAPGGMGGGKGNSNDPTIDPKTLMAAMLDQMGQKKDDDQAPGILNYRTLASDANAPLPAEENFFTRFHADYQEFQRKGQVGL